MKKAIIPLSLIIIAFFAYKTFSYCSFPLQDGYRLQGRPGSHGYVYQGFFTKVINEEIMGVRGSYKNIITGWVRGNDGKTFILHTDTGQVEWVNSSQERARLAELGLPPADMNKDTNLAGLRSGREIFSRHWIPPRAHRQFSPLRPKSP